MKVVKVINNNNLCVLDDNGHEQIVSGKGIGFGKKYGDIVDQNQIQKTYLITDSKLQKKMISLLKEIPEEHMNLANEIVEYIKKEHPAKLDQDRAFVKMMKKYCKDQYLCAEKIQEYILKIFQIDISEDVVLTLTIYLKRLCPYK